MKLTKLDGILGFLINGILICSSCATSEDFEIGEKDKILSIPESEKWFNSDYYCHICREKL